MLDKTVKTHETALGAALMKAIDRAYPENVTTAQSLAPKPLLAEKIAPAVQAHIRKAVDLFGHGLSLDAEGAGDIQEVWLRPSQLVANIASTKNPGVGYQRNPRERISALRKIAAKFDPRLLGIFHTWVNDCGQDECLDGLGRGFTCLHLLKPAYDEPVRVWRHLHIKNVKQAAEWFQKLNPDEVVRVNDKNKFLSRLTEGDKSAKAIQAEAEAGGLVIGGSGRNGISVQAAEALAKLGKLAEVGRVKTAVWGEYKLGGPQFIGLGAYLAATEDNTASRGHGGLHNGISMALMETLNKWGPAKLHQFAAEEYIQPGQGTHARTTAAAFAQAILYKRNLRKQGPNKAVADWSIPNEALADKPFSDRWSEI